jgi:hypothetical protein
VDFYKGQIPIIDDSPRTLALAFPRGAGRGYVPRDFREHPPEMFAPPDQMPLFAESDWDALYDEQEAQRSSLEHVYLGGPGGTPIFTNLDQDGDGYCWAYSTGHAAMMTRAVANQPLVRLNPHATAAILKRGRDEGGWCGLSAKWANEHGYAVEGTGPGQWPLHSRDLRHDTPELRAAMALHRVTEDWVDVARPVYDRNLTTQQVASCLFCAIPCPVDFNWWGHSVCGLRWVRVERGSWGLLILNSWLRWGRHGLGVLRGSRARPDGAVALRVTTASPN